MNLEEALEAVGQGQRVRSDAIPQGWVVKLVGEGWESRVMVVSEATGSSFAFTPTPEREAAEWHLVEGWASYAAGTTV